MRGTKEGLDERRSAGATGVAGFGITAVLAGGREQIARRHGSQLVERGCDHSRRCVRDRAKGAIVTLERAVMLVHRDEA